MKQIGLLVNPIAGLGGPAGMKGSDRPEALSRAQALGIKARSPDRTVEVLKKVCAQYSGDMLFLAPPGDMGVNELREAGLPHRIVGETGVQTTAADTIRLAGALLDAGIDLLVFAGGDGTARDVLSAVGVKVPVFGIPTGVKMHSAVFAIHPSAAAQLIVKTLQTDEIATALEEVVDLDEMQYIAGRIETRLYGYMRVPVAGRLLQSMKGGRCKSDFLAVCEIAQQAAQTILTDTVTCYAVGAGTTTFEVKRSLGGGGTLLGVDVYRGGACLLQDADARALETLCWQQPMKIVISPIGGQGYLFGRGNQQFTPEILRRVGKAGITVLCPPGKLQGLCQKPFLVDTGDEELDAALRGYMRVRVGFDQEVVYKVM